MITVAWINSGSTHFRLFPKLGIPGSKHEEWKYTRIAGLFNKEFQVPANPLTDIHFRRRPGSIPACPAIEQANELVFVNGFYSFSLSRIRSEDLQVFALEEAAKNDFRNSWENGLGTAASI